MERWKGRVAVVTGASSGIGLAIAQALIRDGLIVIGLARRKDIMEKEMANVKGKGRFHAYTCDVSNSENVINAFNWIEDTFHMVHILVNNAGTGYVGKITELDFELQKSVIDVNFTGLLHCTKLTIPLMKNQCEGHIININSTYGNVNFDFKHLPRINTYPSSKVAVKTLAKVIRDELSNESIRITEINPGLTKTKLVEDYQLGTPETDFLTVEDIANTVIYTIALPLRIQIEDLTITPMQVQEK